MPSPARLLQFTPSILRFLTASALLLFLSTTDLPRCPGVGPLRLPCGQGIDQWQAAPDNPGAEAHDGLSCVFEMKQKLYIPAAIPFLVLLGTSPA